MFRHSPATAPPSFRSLRSLLPLARVRGSATADPLTESRPRSLLPLVGWGVCTPADVHRYSRENPKPPEEISGTKSMHTNRMCAHRFPAAVVRLPPQGAELFSSLIEPLARGERSRGCAHTSDQTTTAHTMSNDKKSERIVSYVEPSVKSAVETQADLADQSAAGWVRDAILTKIKENEQEAVLEETNAEQRIEALVAEARDEITAAGEDYRDLLAATAVYSIAGFRLVGDYGDFSDGQRRAALEAAHKTTQDSDHFQPIRSATAESAPADSTTRAETRAEEDSENTADSDDSDSNLDIFDN